MPTPGFLPEDVQIVEDAERALGSVSGVVVHEGEDNKDKLTHSIPVEGKDGKDEAEEDEMERLARQAETSMDLGITDDVPGAFDKDEDDDEEEEEDDVNALDLTGDLVHDKASLDGLLARKGAAAAPGTGGSAAKSKKEKKAEQRKLRAARKKAERAAKQAAAGGGGASTTSAPSKKPEQKRKQPAKTKGSDDDSDDDEGSGSDVSVGEEEEEDLGAIVYVKTPNELAPSALPPVPLASTIVIEPGFTLVPAGVVMSMVETNVRHPSFMHSFMHHSSIFSRCTYSSLGVAFYRWWLRVSNAVVLLIRALYSVSRIALQLAG